MLESIQACMPHASHARCARAQTYFFSGPSYESQLFHHVHVTGIPYGTKCATPMPSISAFMAA